jgi:hypothetical protein
MMGRFCLQLKLCFGIVTEHNFKVSYCTILPIVSFETKLSHQRIPFITFLLLALICPPLLGKTFVYPNRNIQFNLPRKNEGNSHMDIKAPHLAGSDEAMTVMSCQF